MVTFSVDGDWGEIIKKPVYPTLDLFFPLFVLDMAGTTMQKKYTSKSAFIMFLHVFYIKILYLHFH